MLRNCPNLKRVYAPLCRITELGPIKPQAAVGFTELECKDYEFDSEVRKSYDNYIKRQRKALYPFAIGNNALLQHMTERKVIPVDQIEECINYADQQGNTEAKAVLIDYRNREFKDADFLGADFKLTNYRKPREPKPVDKSSPAYLKKVWPLREKSWSVKDSAKGCTFIAKYSGKDSILDFPREIDGVRIDGVSFRAGTKPEAYENITEVHFPDSYRFFGNSCFEGCSALKEVYLPLSVEGIRDKAFMNCSSLETAVFAGEPEWYLIGDKIFRDCTALKDVFFLSPNVSIARKAMFSGCSGYTIHCPAGSKVEQELKGKRCVPLTEDDAVRFAKEYFTEPIRRKIYFNRSNMGSRNSIKAGEPVEVLMNGEELVVRRENGVLYKLPVYTMFEKYITGKIVVEPYQELYYYGKSAYCFEVELTLKEGIE